MESQNLAKVESTPELYIWKAANAKSGYQVVAYDLDIKLNILSNTFAKIDFDCFCSTLSAVEAYDFSGLQTPSTSLRVPFFKLAKVL